MLVGVVMRRHGLTPAACDADDGIRNPSRNDPETHNRPCTGTATAALGRASGITRIAESRLPHWAQDRTIA